MRTALAACSPTKSVQKITQSLPFLFSYQLNTSPLQGKKRIRASEEHQKSIRRASEEHQKRLDFLQKKLKLNTHTRSNKGYFNCITKRFIEINSLRQRCHLVSHPVVQEVLAEFHFLLPVLSDLFHFPSFLLSRSAVLAVAWKLR